MTIISICAVVGIICITISICVIYRRLRHRARHDDKVSRAAQPGTEMSVDSLFTMGIERGVSTTPPSLPLPLSEPPRSLPPPLSEPPRSLPPSAAPRTFEGDLYQLQVGSAGIVLGDTPQGVVIAAVVADGQASKAGVPVGGLITAINGEPANENKASLNRQLASAARPLKLRVKVPAEVMDPFALPSPQAMPINLDAAQPMRFANLALGSDRPMRSASKSLPGKEDRFSSHVLSSPSLELGEAKDESSTSAKNSVRSHITLPVAKPAEQVKALAALLSARGPSGGQSGTLATDHQNRPPSSQRFDVYEEQRPLTPESAAVGLVALHRAAEENDALSGALNEMNEQKKNLAALRAEERLMQREDAMQRRNAEREAARQLRLELEAAEAEAEAAAEAAATAAATMAAEDARRAKERVEQERREQIERQRLSVIEKAKAEAESAAAELLRKREERATNFLKAQTVTAGSADLQAMMRTALNQDPGTSAAAAAAGTGDDAGRATAGDADDEEYFV